MSDEDRTLVNEYGNALADLVLFVETGNGAMVQIASWRLHSLFQKALFYGKAKAAAE